MAFRRQKVCTVFSLFDKCNKLSASKFKEELLKKWDKHYFKFNETVLKQLYLDNVKSVSDEPIRENRSSSEFVSNELVCNNSQSSEVAEISTPEREIPQLLGNLTEVVAGLKNSMNSFNVNQVNSSAARSRPELPRIIPGNDEESRNRNIHKHVSSVIHYSRTRLKILISGIRSSTLKKDIQYTCQKYSNLLY